MLNRFRPSKRASAAEASGHLESAPVSVLDRAAPSPSLEPFFTAVDTAVEEWSARPGKSKRALIFVLPPHDEFSLMQRWAESRKLAIVPAPSVQTILARDFTSLPEMDAQGELLVIPELEDWFRRQHSGLALVRELISRLSEAKRRCVIGVNSWAWTYLARAADADVELPVPLTLASFDEQALCVWLSELAESGNRGAWSSAATAPAISSSIPRNTVRHRECEQRKRRWDFSQKARRDQSRQSVAGLAHLSRQHARGWRRIAEAKKKPAR